MSDKSFVSLNEYSSEEKNPVVPEHLILEKDDDDGVIGNIIDRGLTFVPRAVRFKKAKRIMKKSLSGYISKAKRVIDKFAKSFQTKVNTIDPEYKSLKKKVDKLVAEDKDAEAKTAMETHLKELTDYKKDQMAILDKAIEDIFSAYTNAVDKRIDSEGFVLNVELSEKGKGELKAKWQELGAGAKMKIDEHKTGLIKSAGWKRIDAIISEIAAFIESRKYSSAIESADFHVESIKPYEKNAKYWRVHAFLRISGARLKTKEKGLLIGPNPDQLDLRSASKVIKFTGTNRYQLGGWKSQVLKTDPEWYIRPYILTKEIQAPIYGDTSQISSHLGKESGEREVISGGTDFSREGNIVGGSE